MSVHEDIMKQMHGSKPDSGKAKPTGFIDQIPGW